MICGHPALRLGVICAILTLVGGCASELMKTDVVRPIETKITYYKALEIPVPELAKGIPQIANDLQQRMINELTSLGRFKRVKPVVDGEDDTLVVKAMVRKWDEGSAFLRWMGSIIDFGGNVYEQYTKSQVGNVSGTVGDGYLLVDFKFLDKQSNDVVGQISVKGLSDDPESPRSAEDRVVHSLVKYVESRIEAATPSSTILR